MCKQTIAFALSAAAQSKNPVEQLGKLHTACLQFGSDCEGTRAKPIVVPTAGSGCITNPTPTAATGRGAHSKDHITQGSPHVLSNVVLKQSHRLRQLREQNQMLSNMVQTCKPATAATGMLQAPLPVVTQLTFVAFEAAGESGIQPKQKKRKTKT